MRRYYFKAEYKTGKRGYDRLISVYKMNKKGRFAFIGERWVNTSSYRGDDAIVCQILHDEKGYRWADTGTHYYLKKKDIQIICLP